MVNMETASAQGPPSRVEPEGTPPLPQAPPRGPWTPPPPGSPTTIPMLISQLLPILALGLPFTGASPLQNPAPEPVLQSAADDGQDLIEEYKKRRAEAEGDVEKLWKVANWSEANGLDKEFRSVLRAIVKLDDTDKKAHELLDHVYYDGQWFTTKKKYESYKKKHEAQLRKEEEQRAKDEGLVRHGDKWVRPEDLARLEQGLIQDEDGNWINPEEQKRLAEGWVRQDLEWVSPEDKANVDNGLWKCDDAWLSLADANAYHAEIGKWWRIPGEHYIVYSTCTREIARQALEHADRTQRDLIRIFGVSPLDKPHFLVLNSAEQYGSFASGSQEEQRMGAESKGLSSVHGSFFADFWLDVNMELQTVTYMGAGVSYWDPAMNGGDMYGQLWARHAAGHSFLQQIDSSPEALHKMMTAPGPGFVEEFWAEKKVPLWFRYGAAAYVERYFTDQFVAADGDPYWARKWSASNIANQGGLDPLDRIYDFEITVDDAQGSGKLINEAGLLVAFLVDGECEALVKEHEKLKESFRKAKQDPKRWKDVERSFQKIEKLIKSNDDALAAFAGF